MTRTGAANLGYSEDAWWESSPSDAELDQWEAQRMAQRPVAKFLTGVTVCEYCHRDTEVDDLCRRCGHWIDPHSYPDEAW